MFGRRTPAEWGSERPQQLADHEYSTNSGILRPPTHWPHVFAVPVATAPGPMKRLAQRLLDATARRPTGWIGRRTYGGKRGAPKAHEAVFDHVLQALGPLTGDACLEIGFGGGRLLERMLEGGAEKVAGLDHSPEMVALASARNREAIAAGRLELRQGDTAKLPWPGASFTAAVAANVFFFLDRPEDVLSELSRVLKPGGRLVIATVPGPLPRPSLRTWWVWVWGPDLRAYTDAEMRAMQARAGFDEVRVESRDVLQLSYAVRPR